MRAARSTLISLCLGAARGEPRAVVDRSEDASCLLGLEGLAVERIVLTAVGVKIVQLVTDDRMRPGVRGARSCRPRAGLGADAAAGPAVRRRVRADAVAQAAMAVPHRGL